MLKKLLMVMILVFACSEYSFAALPPAVSSDAANSAVTITTTTTQGGKPNEVSTTQVTIPVNSSSAPSAADDKIVADIYSKYAGNPALIGTTLTVFSLNGIVTVNGSVTAQSQADAAIGDARSIQGVRDVRSAITVVTHPRPYVPPKLPNY